MWSAASKEGFIVLSKTAEVERGGKKLQEDRQLLVIFWKNGESCERKA